MEKLVQFFKDRWAATGWPVILGGLASGGAVLAVYIGWALASGHAYAQTVNATTINANPGPLNIRVTGATNGRTSVVTIDDNAWVSAKGVSVSQDLNAGGAITGKSVTVGNDGLVVNGNANLTKNLTVGGTLNASKLTGLSQGAVNATSKDAVNGAQLHTTNTNVTAVNDRLSGQVSRIDGQVTRLDGQVTRLDGQVTRVDTIVQDADAVKGRVTAAEGKVVDLRTDLGTETTARIEGDKRVTAEANSRADAGDAATLNAANSRADAGDAATLSAAQNHADAGDAATLSAAQGYADAGDRRTLGQANAYTDQQIGAVRHEVAQVRKQVDAVGAVAMAASVVGGVSVADGKKTAVTAAVGSYGNSTALAVGVTHIVAPNKRLFGTISRASGSKTGMGLGASFSF
jgi:autotransporter adhesin